MSGAEDVAFEITPQVLLKAYACGIFPMAESADDPGMFWVEPEMRGILPLDRFHIPRSLKKTLRQRKFEIRFDTAFDQVISTCAEENGNRKQTWINRRIRQLYGDLNRMGHAHSFETWHDDKLVGGLYGVRLGSAFFGESMFSRMTDASKVCLVHLVYEMRRSGFLLLDTQFTTEHLERFGVVEVTRDEYQELLQEALVEDARFTPQVGGATSESILQLFSQTS